MARIVNAQHATLIGTPQQLRTLLGLLARGAQVVDLRFANVVVLDSAPSLEHFKAALATTPQERTRR